MGKRAGSRAVRQAGKRNQACSRTYEEKVIHGRQRRAGMAGRGRCESCRQVAEPAGERAGSKGAVGSGRCSMVDPAGKEAGSRQNQRQNPAEQQGSRTSENRRQ